MISDIVVACRKFAPGKKTLVFCLTVEQAKQITGIRKAWLIRGFHP